MKADRGLGAPYRYFGIFRFVLAGMVVWQHFCANLAPAALHDRLARFSTGSIAVLVFFSLSGFIIAEAVDRIYRGRPAAFLSNRLLRIVPHFVCTVLLLVALDAVLARLGVLRISRQFSPVPATAFTATNILLNPLGFLPLSDRLMSFNFFEIGWAIRVEMAFYIVVGFCVALHRMLGMRLDALLLGVAAVMVPVFALAMIGRTPAMFTFVPYFAFGAALYWATLNARAGWVVAATIPGMAWQFLSLPSYNPALGFERPVGAECLTLCLLLGVMVWLTFARFTRFRAQDRWLGALTYPLYVYHEAVLILLLSLVGIAGYATFWGGMLLSLPVALALARALDPMVDRLRDRVRGRRLVEGVPSSRPALAISPS